MGCWSFNPFSPNRSSIIISTSIGKIISWSQFQNWSYETVVVEGSSTLSHSLRSLHLRSQRRFQEQCIPGARSHRRFPRIPRNVWCVSLLQFLHCDCCVICCCHLIERVFIFHYSLYFVWFCVFVIVRDEDALVNTKCPKNLELRWQTEVSSSIYATPLIADINRWVVMDSANRVIFRVTYFVWL